MIANPSPRALDASAAMLGSTSLRLADPQQHLPFESTKLWNTYRDRDDDSLLWYVPELRLADDPDAGFAFAATQVGQDKNGNPYNRARLTLALSRAVPTDATAEQQQNAALQLREIALDDLIATLTTSYKDDAGADAFETIAGSVQRDQNGDPQLTFDPLLGAAVVRAYQNLVHDGSATVRLSGSFQVWRVSDDSPDGSVVALAPYDHGLELGTHYAAAAYRPKFTLSEHGLARQILSAEDLREYDRHQSEFSRFTALGDIGAKYASFDRLYIGELSRTIVAIPSKYAILRGSAGTAAVAEAVLDPSAADGSGCIFQFGFELGPTVSAIDLLGLARELAANPASRDCTLVLPTRLDPAACSPLGTAFATACGWQPGAMPHTFGLSVKVGGSAGIPAVADANLFIKELAAAVPPYLTGRLGLKLDDDYPEPVTADVVVNVHLTGASDDLSTSIDPVAQTIVLRNPSPLDLELTRCATADGGAEPDVTPLAQRLAAGQAITLPLPAAHDALTVAVDRTLSVESPLSKAALARYLTFHTENVQTVQYDLGVNASQVDFKGRGWSRIDVSIGFADAPDLAVPQLSLSDLHKAASARVVIPLQRAIGALSGTIACSAQPLDGGASPIAFSLQNDFIDHPLFVLRESDLP